jgi:hypothetical protein
VVFKSLKVKSSLWFCNKKAKGNTYLLGDLKFCGCQSWMEKKGQNVTTLITLLSMRPKWPSHVFVRNDQVMCLTSGSFYYLGDMGVCSQPSIPISLYTQLL